MEIDPRRTHAVYPHVFSRDMLFKRQNQFLTIVQNPIPVFMMILPVAEMGEMANHGGSAAAMVQKGRQNRKINDTYGWGNSIFVFCACGGGGRRAARREVSNLQSSYVKKKNFVLAEFLSHFLEQKNAMHFYVESVNNAGCFPCQCIPYRPIPIEVMIDMI